MNYESNRKRVVSAFETSIDVEFKYQVKITRVNDGLQAITATHINHDRIHQIPDAWDGDKKIDDCDSFVFHRGIRLRQTGNFQL